MQAIIQQIVSGGRVVTGQANGDYNNHHVAPNGSAKSLAAPVGQGARVVEIWARNQDTWVRFGTSAVTVAEPTTEITDGSAPTLIPAGGIGQFIIGTNTHVALLSTGNVLMRYFA